MLKRERKKKTQKESERERRKREREREIEKLVENPIIKITNNRQVLSGFEMCFSVLGVS